LFSSEFRLDCSRSEAHHPKNSSPSPVISTANPNDSIGKILGFINLAQASYPLRLVLPNTFLIHAKNRFLSDDFTISSDPSKTAPMKTTMQPTTDSPEKTPSQTESEELM
jgi:hypothetical protein